MLENGYIRLYRSLLNWEWYSDNNTKILFLHLLLTVNYEDKQWRGMTIKRGQRVYSRTSLAEECKLSEREVRTAISHLISTNEVTSKTTPQYSIITVSNYDKYQQATNEMTSQRPATDQPATSDRPQCNKAKKDNKAKKEPPYISPPTVYGEFQKVKLTDDEYEKLVQRLGKDSTTDYIERLDGWLAEGNTKKNYYATILNWWRKDGSQVVSARPREKVGKGADSSYDLAEIESVMKKNLGG